MVSPWSSVPSASYPTINTSFQFASLPADADAALQGVIGQLGGAAAALRREDDPALAIEKADAVLARYTQLFDESDLP
ncbi:MAG: hypothetical protein ACT4NL_01880 [Pseudomarimonas sp.]